MKSRLYNNTDHANVWGADDGSRRDLVDPTLTNDALTQNGHAAPYFSETFLRGDNALDITLGSVYSNIRFPLHPKRERILGIRQQHRGPHPQTGP